jgi:hypothetical protein
MSGVRDPESSEKCIRNRPKAPPCLPNSHQLLIFHGFRRELVTRPGAARRRSYLVGQYEGENSRSRSRQQMVFQH